MKLAIIALALMASVTATWADCVSGTGRCCQVECHNNVCQQVCN